MSTKSTKKSAKKPVKKSMRLDWSRASVSRPRIIGSTTNSPSPNTTRLNPPNAAATWSWQPTDSPIMSRSTWMASRANCMLLGMRPLNTCRALSRPTVNEELEPMPERAGRSAS